MFSADWERLDEGSPEERACFAALGIHFGNLWLTEGNDTFVNRVRPAPMLSAYHLAEWMAWNWWRLRWEPHSNAGDWAFAHRLATVGGGYVWPNVTISSDGEHVAVIAKPTRERQNTPFRYLSDDVVVVSACQFEESADRFIEQVRGQLRQEKIAETNLDRIWEDVRAERRDPDTAKRRRLEALLGYDPDRADVSAINEMMQDAVTLGERAMNEVAADRPQGGDVLTAAELRAMATSKGFDASPRDIIRLASDSGLPCIGDAPAWRLGAAVAAALREQERLGSRPIENRTLARLAGLESKALTDRTPSPSISFALDHDVDKSRVVLRSKWETGRRFELARLLGDRIVGPQGEKLFPATRAFTYRQRMQRSFAAEFLSPLEVVRDMLKDDLSAENQQDVANHFQVSELMIRTLLVNHGLLGREELDEVLDGAAGPTMT
ncbi:MAG: hypothetical protein JO366_02045 [Methylobacteriaceae bacterium]|nr:hypothetical protein [Methylobacteriaceae bacterium]MBV9243575.1 hypothetical protein [Methylobacteriaceae bacterium]